MNDGMYSSLNDSMKRYTVEIEKLKSITPTI